MFIGLSEYLVCLHCPDNILLLSTVQCSVFVIILWNIDLNATALSYKPYHTIHFFGSRNWYQQYFNSYLFKYYLYIIYNSKANCSKDNDSAEMSLIYCQFLSLKGDCASSQYGMANNMINYYIQDDSISCRSN